MKKALLVLIVCLSCVKIDAQEISRTINPEIGTVVEVTPGQQFYADSYLKPVEYYFIEKPFKSSMPGAMGLPFTFSIDSNKLMRRGETKDGRLKIYVPEKFSASHMLLGSVIAPGDTVGLIVSEDGAMEWFVDNSIHNGTTTIWTRKVKKNDPQPKKSVSEKSEFAGLPLFRLIFLGKIDNEIRIRFEQREADGSFVRDEFRFPIRENGTAVGAVRGAEFVVKVGELRSQVVVLKPMTGEFGLAAPKSTAPPPPDLFKI